MTGAGWPVPETLAVTQPLRRLPHAEGLADPKLLGAWLRNPAIYPLFAKPAAGKYSLNVLSIDSYDRGNDRLVLLGGETISVQQTVERMRGPSSYILQGRFALHLTLADRFGPRLWSVRALVLVQPDGPVIHRALTKSSTGLNPADNYWRAGNMLGAVDIETGRITRAVRGVGADFTICPSHPDTNAALVGTLLPHWTELPELVCEAALIFPGIGTQSWDIALTDEDPSVSRSTMEATSTSPSLRRAKASSTKRTEIICPPAATGSDYTTMRRAKARRSQFRPAMCWDGKRE
jgi:hypothetical protein